MIKKELYKSTHFPCLILSLSYSTGCDVNKSIPNLSSSREVHQKHSCALCCLHYISSSQLNFSNVYQMSLTSNCNLVLLMYKSHVKWYKYVRSWERHLSNQSGKVILNPLVEQQKPFKEPLFPESNLVFTPSEKDVDKAQQLFVPAKNHIIKYCKGVYDPSQVPSHKKTEVRYCSSSIFQCYWME